MKASKIKITFMILFLIGIGVVWISLRPVQIIAIHHNGAYTDIVVKHFPLTEKQKITWWKKNGQSIEKKYGFPTDEIDGYSSISIWNIGDGYKEKGKYDRKCFNDMKNKENCIEKDRLLIIENYKNGKVNFTDKNRYTQLPNGKIVEEK
ncbi:DUF943 family protein [Paramixta manurensis]|uniref:DUF943 family protein n=1 Tax=Paramixta manurensis TaxID=2740817 RepID=A0A6M8UBH8_9GAMM|nr:DUF943 family protein [Erwiniaceae bacterium PD-1]